MRIGIVAGEASGDLLGAKLISALRQHYPDLTVEGIGGPAMIAAGCNSLFDIERLSIVGLIEPLKRLPNLLALRRDVRQHFLTNKPDVFIGIDAPDFNLGLEVIFRKANIPVIHYVSPSVWAWRQGRIKKIKKAVDMMLTVFPFEAEFYKKHHVPVCYVGHPLAEQIPLEIDPASAKQALSLDSAEKYVALLPGSRKQEIHHLSEVMLQAANVILKKHPQAKFITSHINENRAQLFKKYVNGVSANLPIEIFINRSHEVMAAADVVVVASGTATLETMLHKKPMVIVYRLSALTYRIVKWLYKARFFGLPNLLANEPLVPELIQEKVTAENISQYVSDYLDHPEKSEQLSSRFLEIHQHLRQDSAALITQSVRSLL